MHELATNSIKFGVLPSPADRARLSIRWRVADDIMRITWHETGAGILALAPMRTGFGYEFVEEALPYQLGAVTRFNFAPGQFSYAIALPLGEAGRPAAFDHEPADLCKGAFSAHRACDRKPLHG
jgi:two-component sensor histidine kinase